MRHVMWLAVVVLVGCATTEPMYQAPPVPTPPPQPSAQEAPRVPSGLLVQQDLLQLMASDPFPDVTVKEARQAVKGATTRALIRPNRGNMKRAVVIYPYQEGAVYEVWTKEHEPVDLVFSDPEEVTDVNKSDDWWDVQIKVVGEPPNRQYHVVITPKGPDLESTMQVFTSLAVYYLKVTSSNPTAMVAVRWKHPAYAKPLPKLLNPGLYYTDYDVEVVEGYPEWVPEAIWDTGLDGHTLIKLPPRSKVQDIPALYVLTADGKGHVTNWEKRGDWYVVPRLFTRAELRLGHEGAEVVRISRGSHYRAVWCPADGASCPEGVH
jgi:type IV secretion system protein TrbG